MCALANSEVATQLPAQDLDRARAFYADKLGLTPSEERPAGLFYRCRSATSFVVDRRQDRQGGATTRARAASGTHRVVPRQRPRRRHAPLGKIRQNLGAEILDDDQSIE
jgi:catechol 2,3-dioxygenase-like lactoylglutathione lyase family enzyme